MSTIRGLRNAMLSVPFIAVLFLTACGGGGVDVVPPLGGLQPPSFTDLKAMFRGQ